MTLKKHEDLTAQILDSLKKAEDGDYSTIVDYDSGNDDLGRIARALNNILSKTEKRINAIEKFVADLTADAGRYRNIIDSIEESYFEVDLKGRLQFFNERVCRYLDYTEEELQGIHFFHLADQENAKILYEAFHRVYLTGQPIKSFRWEVLKKNKEKLAVEASISLRRDETGTPVGFRGIVRDISERKKAEDDLRLSEQRYRTILEITEEGYLENDLNGNVTFANDMACCLMGFENNQLIGKNYRDYLTPDVADHMRGIFQEIYKTGRPQLLVDYDLVHQNGAVKTYQMNAALMHDHTGKPCGFRILTRDVTLHKQTREALRKSEEKYRNILENMLETYLETDIKGNFVFFNNSLCRVLGYSREELQGASYKSICPPDGPEKFYNDFHEIYRTGKPKTFSGRELVTKNGATLYMDMSISLLRSPAGEPFGFGGLGRDVTDEVKNRRKIEESERHLRIITQNIRDVIWTMDFDLNYTYMSPSVSQLFGFTREEVYQMPLRSILPPDRYKKMQRFVKNQLTQYQKGNIGESLKTTTFEMPMFCKNGKNIWVEISANFNRDENGKPFEIVGVTRDISERKKAAEHLLESEQRYRLIVENIHEIIWTTDLNFQYSYVSPSCLPVTGYTQDEIKKIPLDQLLAPSSLLLAQNTIGEELYRERSGEKFDLHRSRTIEQELYSKNGSTVWLEVTAIFIRDKNGAPTGMLMTGREISERKKAEAEKQNLEEQLNQAQKMETIGRLAGGVAHDFNNMLSVILGYVDLAKMRLAKQHPVLNDIAEIEKAAVRSRDITTQLLAFSRKQIIEPRIIDLNQMVVHTQKSLTRLIGEDVELKVIFGRNLWAIKFDPSQVEQILINLAINARDAMPNGGKLTIQTANTVIDSFYCESHIGFIPGDYIRLTVSDNGTGMDKEILQHIFEPFFTTKEAGKGTGLGLATVYGIVRQNEGFINVYSEPGCGSTFSIYLSRTTEVGHVKDEADEEPEFSGKGNILLVEDDAMVLQIAKGMLESMGFTVTAVNAPADAIAIYKNHNTSFDLVVTDVIMPAMSGKDLRNKLNEIKPDTKLLFMSGYTADVIAHHGVLEKGVHFLQKPFTLKSLAGKVVEALSATSV